MYPIAVFFLLFLNWIVLSGKFDAFHLGLGLVSCAIVAFLSHDLLYHDRSKGLRCRLIEAWAFIRYLPWIIWEVVKANLHVEIGHYPEGLRGNVPPRGDFRDLLEDGFREVRSRQLHHPHSGYHNHAYSGRRFRAHDESIFGR